MRATAMCFMAALALTTAGCGGAPAPVPVTGSPADLRSLAGEWGGEYRNQSNGRVGSIVFKLTAGADTAHGDVVMIPRDHRPHVSPNDPSAGLPIDRSPAVLSIAFVRAESGGVLGELVPYRDPECHCRVITRFEGRIRGDRIEGTFTSLHVDDRTQLRGTWKVRRGAP